MFLFIFFFFSSRRRHTRFDCDWSSDVCSSDLTIFRSGNRPEARMVLTGLGGENLLSEISIFAEARRWRSVTPFSLPRFPNRGGGKPPRPRDLPEGQLIRELNNRGLPEPTSIKRIEGYQVEGRPLVRWLEFHSTR